MSRDARRLATVALATLAAGALVVGIPATVAPRAFFDGFPFLRHWVDLLPPYNAHLVTDVGGLQLAFGLLFAWAAWRPHPALVVPLCLVWALSQALHSAFHLAHLGGFGVGDAIAQTAALAVVTLLPLLPVALCARARQG